MGACEGGVNGKKEDICKTIDKKNTEKKKKVKSCTIFLTSLRRRKNVHLGSTVISNKWF